MRLLLIEVPAVISALVNSTANLEVGVATRVKLPYRTLVLENEWEGRGVTSIKGEKKSNKDDWFPLKLRTANFIGTGPFIRPGNHTFSVSSHFHSLRLLLHTFCLLVFL